MFILSIKGVYCRTGVKLSGAKFAISTGFVAIKLQCFFCRSMKQLSTRHVLNREAGYILLS